MSSSEDSHRGVEFEFPDNDLELVESLVKCLTFSSAFNTVGFETIGDSVLKEMNERAKQKLEEKTEFAEHSEKTPAFPTVQIKPPVELPETPNRHSTTDARQNALHIHDYQRITKSPPESRFTAAHNREFAHSESLDSGVISKRISNGDESPSKRRRAPDGKSLGIPHSPTKPLQTLHIDEPTRLSRISASRNRDRQRREHSLSPRRRNMRNSLPPVSLTSEENTPALKPPTLSMPRKVIPSIAPASPRTRQLANPRSATKPDLTKPDSTRLDALKSDPTKSDLTTMRKSTYNSISTGNLQSNASRQLPTARQPPTASIPGSFPGMFSNHVPAAKGSVQSTGSSNTVQVPMKQSQAKQLHRPPNQTGQRSISNPIHRLQHGRSVQQASQSRGQPLQASHDHLSSSRLHQTTSRSVATETTGSRAADHKPTSMQEPLRLSLARSQSLQTIGRASSQRSASANLPSINTSIKTSTSSRTLASPFPDDLPSYARPTQAALRRSESIQPGKGRHDLAHHHRAS